MNPGRNVTTLSEILNKFRTTLLIALFFLIGITYLTAQIVTAEALALRRDMKSPSPPIILDVRTDSEFAKGHIPTAINIPVDDMSEHWLSELIPGKDSKIYTYCQGGFRSATAIEILMDYGYTNTIDLISVNKWLFGLTGDKGWSIGAPDADIVIEEYIDLACPYCAMAARPHYELFQQYGDRVKFVFHHFPLTIHESAPKAHAALEAAGRQGYFWDYRFSIPKYFDDLSDEHLLEIASFLELDQERFQSDMNSIMIKERNFQSDKIQGQLIGVSGTPTYFVNGVQTINPTEAVDILLSGGQLEKSEIVITENCREEENE